MASTISELITSCLRNNIPLSVIKAKKGKQCLVDQNYDVDLMESPARRRFLLVESLFNRIAEEDDDYSVTPVNQLLQAADADDVGLRYRVLCIINGALPLSKKFRDTFFSVFSTFVKKFLIPTRPIDGTVVIENRIEVTWEVLVHEARCCALEWERAYAQEYSSFRTGMSYFRSQIAFLPKTVDSSRYVLYSELSARALNLKEANLKQKSIGLDDLMKQRGVIAKQLASAKFDPDVDLEIHPLSPEELVAFATVMKEEDQPDCFYMNTRRLLFRLEQILKMTDKTTYESMLRDPFSYSDIITQIQKEASSSRSVGDENDEEVSLGNNNSLVQVVSAPSGTVDEEEEWDEIGVNVSEPLPEPTALTGSKVPISLDVFRTVKALELEAQKNMPSLGHPGIAPSVEVSKDEAKTDGGKKEEKEKSGELMEVPPHLKELVFQAMQRAVSVVRPRLAALQRTLSRLSVTPSLSASDTLSSSNSIRNSLGDEKLQSLPDPVALLLRYGSRYNTLAERLDSLLSEIGAKYGRLYEISPEVEAFEKEQARIRDAKERARLTRLRNKIPETLTPEEEARKAALDFERRFNLLQSGGPQSSGAIDLTSDNQGGAEEEKLSAMQLVLAQMAAEKVANELKHERLKKKRTSDRVSMDGTTNAPASKKKPGSFMHRFKLPK